MFAGDVFASFADHVLTCDAAAADHPIGYRVHRPLIMRLLGGLQMPGVIVAEVSSLDVLVHGGVGVWREDRFIAVVLNVADVMPDSRAICDTFGTTRPRTRTAHVLEPNRAGPSGLT